MKTRAKHAEAGERELIRLFNVGPATLRYLREIGVRTVAQLAKANADDLYIRIQAAQGKPFDPCLHDTFAAIIHEARTGERRPWFAFTAERKRRQSAGAFGSPRVVDGRTMRSDRSG